MNERIEFLKNETLFSRNKTSRRPIAISDFDTSGELGSIPVRKAKAIAKLFESFDELLTYFKNKIAKSILGAVESYNRGAEIMSLYRDGKEDEYFEELKKAGREPVWFGRSPACPLPFLSGLYHGTVDNAQDMIYDTYPIKHKGAMLGSSVEAVNSLAAIKKAVFDDKLYTLKEVTV